MGARIVLVQLGGILFTKRGWLVFFSKKRVVCQVSMELRSRLTATQGKKEFWAKTLDLP